MTTPETVSRRRRRRLAADERAGRFARRRYRQAYRAYLRAQWKVLLVGAVSCLGITAAVALLTRGSMARGLVIGFGVTATVAALTHLVVIASGAAPMMMGELAEQWTAGKLRSLPSDRWRVVNHFGLKAGDIDHVVIGPPGVFLVETKWSASAWTQDWAHEEVEGAQRQVAESARLMGLWQNYKQLKLPAPVPLVALWGSGASDLAASLGRNDVIAGQELSNYLNGQSLVSSHLQGDQIERVLGVMHEHLLKRDAKEAVENPIPESIQALAVRVISGVVAGLLSFVGAGYLLKTGLPQWSWFVLVLAAIGIEQLLRRWLPIRSVITGSQAGLLATVLLTIAVAGGPIIR